MVLRLWVYICLFDLPQGHFQDLGLIRRKETNWLCQLQSWKPSE